MRRFLLFFCVLLVALLVLPPLWYAVLPASHPELPPAGRRVEVSAGLGVNVIEQGAGPAVVLVHGHPGCAYDWEPFMEALAARGLRAIAYDRVGYGRSDARPRGRVTVETNARELLGLLAALDLRDVTLVGASYGGATSIVAAKRDPSRLARLVLVGSVAPGIEARDALPGPLMELLAGPVLSWISRVPPVGRRLRAAFMRRLLEAKGGVERREEVERAAAAVAQALRHAGIRPKAQVIRVQREPFEAHGRRVEAFAPGTRFAKDRLWHVEITFEEPVAVAGPVLIGDGRFLGLGLMAPLRGRGPDFGDHAAERTRKADEIE